MERELQSLQVSQINSTDASRDESLSFLKSKNRCRGFGRSYPHPGGRTCCPAYNKNCHECNGLHHFAKFCRSKGDMSDRPNYVKSSVRDYHDDKFSGRDHQDAKSSGRDKNETVQKPGKSITRRMQKYRKEAQNLELSESGSETESEVSDDVCLFSLHDVEPVKCQTLVKGKDQSVLKNKVHQKNCHTYHENVSDIDLGDISQCLHIMFEEHQLYETVSNSSPENKKPEHDRENRWYLTEVMAMLLTCGLMFIMLNYHVFCEMVLSAVNAHVGVTQFIVKHQTVLCQILWSAMLIILTRALCQSVLYEICSKCVKYVKTSMIK